MRARALAVSVLVGCSPTRSVFRTPSGEADGGDGGAPLDCDTAGTWATVGHPLALTWCTGCHDDDRSGETRHGAPPGVDLDSLAGWQAHGERALARSQAGTMPPGGGLSAEDLAALEAWLACGAPGEEATLAGDRPDTGPTSGSTVWTQVGEEAGGVVVTHDIAERYGDATYGRVYSEAYLQAGGEAWLAGWRWQDADERLILAVDYDPPLPLQGAASDWSAATTATYEAPEDTWTEEQDWAFERLDATDLDPRSPDPRAQRLLAVEAAGAEEGWLLSPDFGVTGRWALDPDGAGVVTQQLLEQGEGSWPGFPLSPGDEFRASLVTFGVLP